MSCGLAGSSEARSKAGEPDGLPHNLKTLFLWPWASSHALLGRFVQILHHLVRDGAMGASAALPSTGGAASPVAHEMAYRKGHEGQDDGDHYYVSHKVLLYVSLC